MPDSDLPKSGNGRAAGAERPAERVRRFSVPRTGQPLHPGVRAPEPAPGAATDAPGDADGARAGGLTVKAPGRAKRRWLSSVRWPAWLRKTRRPASDEAPAEPAEPGVPTRGLHALTRSCDAWFSDEAERLEHEAVELARSAAAANLPRMEVAYGDVEEEAQLAGRARAVLHGWADRVRTRVEDAVQESLHDASERTETYEHEIGALSGTLNELKEGRTELRRAEAQAEAGQAQLEVRRFLPAWMYVLLIGLLVSVDWVANVPVFTELLPKDPGADAAWRELVARSETMGLWGGVYRIWARAVHNIDASLLALGVIVFLVWLAHVLGESLRRLLSHSKAETPAAALTIRSHRRQFIVPAVLSLVGITAVVGVLWLARERVEATTAERLASVETQIDETAAELSAASAAGDLTAVGTLEQEMAGLQVLRGQRAERAEYATVIARMNLPILLLNVVLALAAAVAAYLMTRDAMRGALVSPHAPELRRHLHELRGEAVRRRDGIVRTNAEIESAFARAEYLLGARPLRGWGEKADRLRGVIPRFRSENARRRGTDTANIAAFTRPPRLELALPGADQPIARPPEIDAYRRRHQALRERASEVLARMQRETPYAREAEAEAEAEAER